MWKIIDLYCGKSKDLYNKANFIVREEFVKNNYWIRFSSLDKLMQKYDDYYSLGSQSSQETLKLLDRNWSSFFKSIKSWSKNKGRNYLGKPKLPGYKKEKGKSVFVLKNIQFKIVRGEIYFSLKSLNKFSGIKTNVKGKPLQIRFIPKGSCYYMEIVYEKRIKEINKTSRRIIGIDLGLNNFATISNNIGIEPIIINGGEIKSINQYYNKKTFQIRKTSSVSWSNREENLLLKRNEKIEYNMHVYSKRIIEYCKINKIDTIVIGINNGWKQRNPIGQSFSYIPYENFINKLKYKCEDSGIIFIETEESYTSGTSFLDKELPIKENYNKKRRIKRGLFLSDKGILINADLNGSYQIIKKVFPNAFSRGRDRGCGLHPVRVNL